MTLALPESRPQHTTDTEALLRLATIAAATRHQELQEQDRQDDEQAVFHARAEAVAAFGTDGAAALGQWKPSLSMPEDHYRAVVELLPRTSLIATMPRDGSGCLFEVVSYCVGCHTERTVLVGGLEELAAALGKVRGS
ncbi:hypothetical protein [Streptomyces microflavus]|uniref:hypothetical protein n=1 Tax=Streptomyces microflavus TaxID=1919 RepID=UPI00386CCEEA|nr:hypothetical protein OG269_25970 [Streptomyces microflavus]